MFRWPDVKPRNVVMGRCRQIRNLQIKSFQNIGLNDEAKFLIVIVRTLNSFWFTSDNKGHSNSVSTSTRISVSKNAKSSHMYFDSAAHRIDAIEVHYTFLILIFSIPYVINGTIVI